jgi:transcriptional regulator with GAF, ATPase, and Fis domain
MTTRSGAAEAAQRIDEAAPSGVHAVHAVHAIARAPGSSSSFPSLDDAMRAHISAALALTTGRIEGRGGAADLLSLNPHTLRGKMRRLGIDWSAFRARAR